MVVTCFFSKSPELSLLRARVKDDDCVCACVCVCVIFFFLISLIWLNYSYHPTELFK